MYSLAAGKKVVYVHIINQWCYKANDVWNMIGMRSVLTLLTQFQPIPGMLVAARTNTPCVVICADKPASANNDWPPIWKLTLPRLKLSLIRSKQTSSDNHRRKQIGDVPPDLGDPARAPTVNARLTGHQITK